MFCRYCKKNKEESLFIKNKRTKDGQKGTCKECKSKMDKEYREKNKEKLSKYFSQLWEASHKRRTKNKESVDIRRTGINASEYLKDKNCSICGISNEEHLKRYNQRLHIHHGKNTGRNYIENGKKPIHEDLVILCVSCHTSHAVKNKQHSSFDNSKALLKGWKTRRSKNEIRKS